MNAAGGRLLRVEMRLFENKRFQLHRAGRPDAAWLQDMPDRGFDNHVKLNTGDGLITRMAVVMILARVFEDFVVFVVQLYSH